VNLSSSPHLVGLVLLFAGCGRSAPSPSSAVAARQAGTSVQFTEVTQQAGIHFKHFNGAAGHRYLPETMGAGGAFLDYDGDGWQDILLLNGKPLGETGRRGDGATGRPTKSTSKTVPSSLPGRPVAPSPRRPVASSPTSALYHNNRDGTFTDVTHGSGLDVPMYAMGCAIGDYDNDGRDDIYVSCALEPGHLFHNEGGGKFRDVTPHAGVGDLSKLGTSCAWLDYDNDGWLDLFICNYVQYSLATDHACYEGGKRYYCRPNVYQPDTCILYHNRGDGSFEDVTKQTGVWNKTGNSLGVAVWDFDEDGWQDITVANDLTPNYLFHNLAGALSNPRSKIQDPKSARRFEEVGLDWGIAFGEDAKARAGMGIDVAEYRNDGHPALMISNFTGEPLSFFVEDGPHQFSDEAFEAGVGESHLHYLGFGLFFFDYDNDGFKDAFVGNGHIEPSIADFGGGVTYAQQHQLYRNLGNGTFAEVGERLGAPFTVPHVTRGAAYGDYDNDGDLDIVVMNNGQPAELLRNEGGNRQHWLQVELVGRGPGGGKPGSNRDGIGARVTVRAGAMTQRDFVRSGSSYCSQSMLRRHFGLGAATEADEIEVRWPSGIIDRMRNVRTNQRITVREGQGMQWP
jgi:enediyne biosynthesis protein E4